MVTELTVAQLSTWLSEQSENTPDTPYDISLTDVTDTNITYIKSYLQANPTKYVNLSPTYITNYSMSLSYLFENCTTLIESPRFMAPTYGLHPSMYATFRGCTNLKYGYLISGTQDASNAFQGCTSLISFPGGTTSSLRDISYFCYGCTSLQSMPYLPDVTNMEGAFRDCTSLTSITNIPSSVRNIAYAFKGCTGITSAPDIPYGITSLESTFEGCTGITTFSFPLSVRNVKNCFKGVTSLETVNNVPSGITNAESCFEGCTSLTTINLFSIPLNTLKNNVNFKDMFKGCTSLTSIGSAVEMADDWHIFYFRVLAYPTYGGINGRIYDREGNYTEVSYYGYSGNINMVFFQLTDELWFPPNLMLDADVFSVIEKVISKKVSYFNKEVVDPEKKTFIMYADDPEEVHTNLKLGGGITVYDTEEELEEDLPNKQEGDLVGTLSADEGELQDAPLGSVIPYLGTTDPSDGKWLICDGRDTTGTAIELETHYPSLYMFLGGTNVLPDLREVTLVGVGENTTDNIADHDIYTIGQFKDDQIQDHAHQVWTCDYKASSKTGDYLAISDNPSFKTEKDWNVLVGRIGTTTHGKQKGVNYIIKAVSSVDTYNVPSSEIAQIESYVDNGLNTIKNNGLSYRTTETWTGGYWIDGKKIYRRVFTGLSVSLSSNNFSNVLPQSSVPNIAIITSAKGWYSDTICFNFTEARIQNSYISVESTYGGSRTIDTFCIEYTKTTD